MVPVGATKLTWGGNKAGSSDWFDAALEKEGAKAPVRYDDTDGVPIDEIAKLSPDLILATNSGIEEEDYKKLTKIAPVVAYPDAPWVTPWQTSLETVGKALGRTEEAEKVKAESEKAIEAAKEENPQLDGKSLIFGYLATTDLSSVGIYAPEDPRVSFMHDLGLEDAPSVADAIKPGEFYGTVSAEKASDLESDVFLTWSENPGDMKTFSDHKLVGKIPAIEEGHAYAEEDKHVSLAVTNPTPLSIPFIVEEFVPQVSQGRRRLVNAVSAPPRGQVDRAPSLGRPGTWGAAVGLVAALVVVSAASVLLGARWIPPGTLFDPDSPLHGVAAARLDRTLLGLVAGGALGLVGALMQGLTRNPLADPGILGINAGAAFAMVLAISVFGVSDLQDYVWFAFAGAAAAMVLVHAIAAVGRDGATPVKVAIAGAALTAALSSWTSGVLLIDRKTVESFRLWNVGTVAGRDLDVLMTGLPFIVVGVVLAMASIRSLNALALGDDLARGLGRRLAVDRLVVGVAVVLLAGAATALAGPIAFVGLIVPHGVRAVVGPDYRRVLPMSLGYGAVLVVAADVVGRLVLPPSEVQVGIMTAVIGVPVFLHLIRRGRIGAL